MTQPPKTNDTSSTHSPAQMEPRSSRRDQRNRRQYALPRFDFEDATHAPQGSNELTSYTLASSCPKGQPQASEQRIFPVSPCINAIDRAHRAHLRLASTYQPPASQETFCDITPLLQESPKHKPIIKEDEIPDMELEEEEEDVGGEFEVIEKRECGVVHNGTERRWWRGFRR